MKKFLLSTTKFLLFSFILYTLILCVWGEYCDQEYKKNINYKIGVYGHMHTRIKELHKTSNIDLLFLGSSHTYRGFDTRIFQGAGYNSFNLGSSAQTPLQTELLVNRYIKQLKPRIIVFEIYPKVFMLDGVESSIDLLANDKKDWAIAKMMLSQKNFKSLNTLIYASYRDWFGKDDDFKEPKRKRKDLYIPGGYVERDLEYYKHKKFKPYSMKIHEYQFEAFKRILNTLKDNNIEVILVQSPTAPNYYNSCRNNDEFENRIDSLNFEYINYNTILQLDDSLHFYDKDHMNQKGVDILNKQLVDYLKAKKEL